MANATPVSIRRAADPATLVVRTPYNFIMARLFSRLGGEWIECRQTWLVDAAREALIRDMCRDIFGTDGDDNPECVDVRVHVLDAIETERYGVYLMGREVARIAPNGAARLGRGVQLVAGPSPCRGADRWATRLPAGAVIQINGVPRAAVQALRDEPRDDVLLCIAGEPPADQEALRIERDKLARRLAALDAMLASGEPQAASA